MHIVVYCIYTLYYIHMYIYKNTTFNTINRVDTFSMKIDDYYVMKFSSLPLQFIAMSFFYIKMLHFSARNFYARIQFTL